jgi:hypothetical protein
LDNRTDGHRIDVATGDDGHNYMGTGSD